MDCIKFQLDKRAQEYIMESLKGGHALSKCINKNVDVNKGIVFTYLPQNTDEKSLYDFSGAVLPPSPNKYHVKHTDGSSTTMIPIESTEDYLINEVKEYLSQGDNRLCILENRISEPQDLVMKELKSRTAIYNSKEVYHLLSNQDLEKETMLGTINDAEHLVTLVGVMSKISRSFIQSIFSTKVLDDVMLNEITKNADKILIGAYDFEGYLIWNKIKPIPI